MRDIKFRLWDKDNKQMDLSPDFDYIDGQIWIALVHYELMQYTGLKDKNGREIYEGDILKTLDEQEIYEYDEFGTAIQHLGYEEAYRLKVVKYEKGQFSVIWNTPSREIEVVGNIYENSKLLEE
jgi:uncharacterized phage protein (TIGR01671 family)